MNKYIIYVCINISSRHYYENSEKSVIMSFRIISWRSREKKLCRKNIIFQKILNIFIQFALQIRGNWMNGDWSLQTRNWDEAFSVYLFQFYKTKMNHLKNVHLGSNEPFNIKYKKISPLCIYDIPRELISRGNILGTIYDYSQ